VPWLDLQPLNMPMDMVSMVIRMVSIAFFYHKYYLNFLSKLLSCTNYSTVQVMDMDTIMVIMNNPMCQH